MPFSRDEPNLIEDLMAMGSNLLGATFGARHEWGAQARERMESLAHRLNIVSREDFEATKAMIAKARDMQETLNERLSVIESHLGIKPQQQASARATASKPKRKAPPAASRKKNRRVGAKS